MIDIGDCVKIIRRTSRDTVEKFWVKVDSVSGAFATGYVDTRLIGDRYKYGDKIRFSVREVTEKEAE